MQEWRRDHRINTFETFAWFALFEQTFFIFFNTIGLNIIFGIIVDTFSELRDLKVIITNVILLFNANVAPVYKSL